MMKPRNLFFFFLFFSLFTTTLWAKIPPQSEWKGDTDAFHWSAGNTLLSIDPDYEGRRASIYKDEVWRTDKMLWRMATAFLSHPTTSNSFEWDLFTSTSADERRRYLVQPSESGQLLILKLEIYKKKGSGFQLYNRLNLIRLDLTDYATSMDLLWQNLEIEVQKKGDRLLLKTRDVHAKVLKEETSIEESPDVSYRAKTVLTAFFSKRKREILRWTTLSLNESESQQAAPKIEKVEGLSLERFRLFFDQPVDISQARASVDEGAFAIRLEREADERQVLVSSRPPFEADRRYHLHLYGLGIKGQKGLYDLHLELDVMKDEDDAPSLRDLVISELMPNPSGNTQLGPTEYIELYNPTRGSLSLDNYSLEYNGKSYELPPWELRPHGFVVLHHRAYTIQGLTPGSDLALERFPSLHNSHFELALHRKGERQAIDHVQYASTLYLSGTPNAGVSVERLDLFGGTKDKASEPQWASCMDPRGGTPGEKAASAPFDLLEPGALIINEVLAAPKSGGEDFVELYNASKQTIDLRNAQLCFRSGSANSQEKSISISDTSLLLAPSAFIVLTHYKPAVVGFYPQNNPETIYEQMALPELPNTYFTLQVKGVRKRVLLDEMSYRKQYLGLKERAPAGTSLERIRPEAVGQEAASWRPALSSVGGGTPGLPNSVLGLDPLDRDKISPAWPEESQLPFEDVERLAQAYSDRSLAYIYSMNGITVHRSKGGKIHQLLHAIRQGQNPLQLPIGVYLFYLEVGGPDGEHAVMGSFKWLVEQ